MKKILIIILLLLPFVCFSCQDDLDDEQFEKFILLVKNSYQEYELKLNASGEVTVPLSVGINGTSTNNENIKVRIGLDIDTLKGYNNDKYKGEEALFNELYPLTNFELSPSDSVITIESGKEYATFYVTFTGLNDLENKYAEYILPFSIKEVSNYRIAKPDHSTTLMRILLSNDFSGSYAVEGNVYEDGGGSAPVTNAALRAVSFDECFTYAGNFNASNKDRDLYIIHIKKDENNNVTLSALHHDEIDFEPMSSTVEISEVINPSDKRLNVITTVFDLEYKYTDISSNPSTPLRMRFKGKITNTREVLIDELED